MKLQHSSSYAGAIACVGSAFFSMMVVSATNAATVPTGNLALWLDAGTGVTSGVDGVSAWADQSGNGNHAVQANTARQPTPIASDAAFNNQPTIQFNGSSDLLQAPLPLTSVGGLTVYVVAQYQSTGAYRNIVGASNGDYGAASQWMLMESDASSANYAIVHRDSVASGTTTLGAADTGLHVYALEFDGANTSMTYSIDDSTSTVGAIFNDITVNTFDIGAYVHFGTPYDFANINIAEILVYSGTLSAGDKASIAEYLSDKYVAVPEPSAVALIGIGGSILMSRKRRSR